MTDRDDRYYIELIQKGDRSAFSYLVSRHADLVYSICLKMLKNSNDAEDLAQEVFITAFRSLNKFKGDARFSTWLYRIAFNKSVSVLRKKNRNVYTDKEDFLEHMSSELESMPSFDDHSAEQYLKKAIGRLTDEEQLMITLHYYEEQSMEDIAKIMRLSKANVKVKLFRARKKLRELIPQEMNTN